MKEDSKQRDYDKENNLIKPRKRTKIPKWLKIIFFIPLVIITIHFTFYFQTQKMFNTNKSVNLSATNYFIHANTIALVWINSINQLHIFDNKSFIMKPFIFMVDYFYKKGEKLVAKDNAEDAVWWYITYYAVYDFHIPSLVFEKLSLDERRALQKRTYNNAMRLMQYGVKGVELGKYETSFIPKYVHLATYELFGLYEGKRKERLKKFCSDNVLQKKY